MTTSAAVTVLFLLCTTVASASSQVDTLRPTSTIETSNREEKGLLRGRKSSETELPNVSPAATLKDDADHTLSATTSVTDDVSAHIIDTDEFPPFPPFHPVKDGVSFSRSISQLEKQTSFSLTFSGDHCTSKDSYGSNTCHYNWGDTIEANVTVKLGVDLDEGDTLIGHFRADHVVPYSFSCSVCGEDCVLKVPVVNVEWRFETLPCPITTDTIVNTIKRDIGDSSPTDGIPTHLEGQIEVVKKSGDNVAQFSVSVDIK